MASVDGSGNTIVTESTLADPVLTSNTTINTTTSGTTSTFEQQTSTVGTAPVKTVSNDIIGNPIDQNALAIKQNGDTSATGVADNKQGIILNGSQTATVIINAGQ